MMVSFGNPVAIGRGGIRDAAFSADRETIAIGWTNGVSLTGVNDQKDIWYSQTPQMVTALDYSSSYVAAVLVTGDVWLFNTESGASRIFEGVAIADSYWGDVAWSPDGKLAAIQTIGGTGAGATPILILDPAANEIRELPGSRTDPGWRPHLRWSPDSRMIAAADRRGQAWVLDLDTGEVVYRVEEPVTDYRPRIHGWVPGSTTVVYDAPRGSGLRFVDVTTGEFVLQLDDLSLGSVLSPPIYFAPHSELALFAGGTTGAYEIPNYEVWDLAAGNPLDVPPVGEQRHVNMAGCMWLDRPAVAFSGEEILYLDTDGKLVRWQVGDTEGDLLGWLDVRYPCLGTPMVWSPDSTRLVLETDPSKAVTVWDVPTGQLIAKRQDGTYPADIYGTLLVYRNADEGLTLWNLESEEVLSVLPGPVTQFPGGVAFSPDGSLLAYGAGNALQIADVASDQILAVLDTYSEDQQISHIRWAPGSDALAVAGGFGGGITDEPGTVILWEREGDLFQEVFRTETIHANYDVDWANPALFSPSGELVALEQMPEMVSGQRAVLVYDRVRGEVLLERQGYVIQQWLSDKVLLAAEAEGWSTYVEWHVSTGEERSVRRGGLQAELGAYAPNGIHLADILHDPPPPRSIVISNWRTGKKVTTDYLGSDVQDVRFSPDGQWLVARGTDGLVKVWPVNYSSFTND